MHVLEYFQQIYVINLPHRSDRRREMAEQLKKIGLSFDNPEVRLFRAVRPDEAGGFPSIGARGCFLSHLGVLRDAAQQQYERILIFEDDLNFAPDFTERIDKVICELRREDWSLFYGGFAMKNQPHPAKSEVLVHAAPADSIQNAHFVAFQGQAIRETVGFLEAVLSRPPGDPKGGPMHVDGAYGWYRYENPSRNTLLAVPELGFQRSSRTDIHALRWFDKTPGVRLVASWLRSWRNS